MVLFKSVLLFIVVVFRFWFPNTHIIHLNFSKACNNNKLGNTLDLYDTIHVLLSVQRTLPNKYKILGLSPVTTNAIVQSERTFSAWSRASLNKRRWLSSQNRGMLTTHSMMIHVHFLVNTLFKQKFTFKYYLCRCKSYALPGSPSLIRTMHNDLIII